MRVRTISLILIFIGSIVSPLISTTSAELEDLGPAGEVSEFDHPILNWWVLDNGNVIVASVDGYVIEYVSLENGSYTEIWSEFTNKTLFSGALNIEEGLLAVGTSDGVIVISLDYMEELYRYTLGQQVDAIAWDSGGDIWATQRISKTAIEWDTEANAQSGISTTPHNNGITDVVSLSSGHILTSGRDKQVRIHDENGSFIHSMSESQSPLLRLAVSNDESMIFGMTDNCGLEIYSISSWSRVNSLNLCSNGQGRSMQQLGNRLMLGMTNGNVFSIDVTNVNDEQEFSVQGEVVGFRSAAGAGVYVLTTFSTSSEVHLLDADRDGDGTVDGLDIFPDDATQDSDFDGDGFGDNPNGNNSDAFPSDSTQWLDSDGDGYGDNPTGNNPDAFPQNPDQNTDSDGDGYGDNRYADQGDKFTYDSTQWADTDGDGYGDNQELGATSPDACPNQSGESLLDRLGCQDTDGDGWSDPGNGEDAHPSGNADAFPMEPSQWRDTDGDGYGDNLSGFRGDACPTLAGTSTRAITFQPSENDYVTISRYGCTDTDSDGYDDTTETSNDGCSMVGNRTEWLDQDRDCMGSNGDYNDTDPEVQTIDDHCVKHPDGPVNCAGQDSSEMDSGNLTVNEEEKSTEVMVLVKEFAVFAGYIVVAMAIALVLIVGTLRVVGKARDKRKPDAQYTHQDATKELDAWESGENFETRGGIDEQKAWGDEPMEESKESMDVDIVEENIVETDVEYEPGEMSIPVDDTSAEEEQIEESGTTPEQPPAEMAPLPSGGLPEGWTMEQWRWYGHQWLEKHGQN